MSNNQIEMPCMIYAPSRLRRAEACHPSVFYGESYERRNQDNICAHAEIIISLEAGAQSVMWEGKSSVVPLNIANGGIWCRDARRSCGYYSGIARYTGLPAEVELKGGHLYRRIIVSARKTKRYCERCSEMSRDTLAHFWRGDERRKNLCA